jgi:hypothetical protein
MQAVCFKPFTELDPVNRFQQSSGNNIDINCVLAATFKRKQA